MIRHCTSQKNLLTSGRDPVPDIDSRSLSTSRTIVEQGILDLLGFLIQSPADFHDSRWNDWW